MSTIPDEFEPFLTADERAIYEQATRTAEAVAEMLARLDARDTRSRAVWRAAQEEASCVRLVLEWQANERARERAAQAIAALDAAAAEKIAPRDSAVTTVAAGAPPEPS